MGRKWEKSRGEMPVRSSGKCGGVSASRKRRPIVGERQSPGTAWASPAAFRAGALPASAARRPSLPARSRPARDHPTATTARAGGARTTQPERRAPRPPTPCTALPVGKGQRLGTCAVPGEVRSPNHRGIMVVPGTCLERLRRRYAIGYAASRQNPSDMQWLPAARRW